MLAAPSDAATYGTTVTPNPFFFPTFQLVYRLHVTTGVTAERLRVSAGPGPSFPGGGGYFMELGEMTLEGLGTVVNRSR